MPSVVTRMNVLKALNNIKYGPGSALLPPDISRIHMEFPIKANPGQLGPRKFWREHLPRLKYWNPAVPMVVNRTVDLPDAPAPLPSTKPAILSIYLHTPPTADLSSSSTAAAALPSAEWKAAIAKQQFRSTTDGSCPAPPPVEGEHVVTIDMTTAHSDKILSEFMEKTGARPVEVPEEERLLRLEIEDMREKAKGHRAYSLVHMAEVRREKAFKEKIRREADELKAANAA